MGGGGGGFGGWACLPYAPLNPLKGQQRIIGEDPISPKQKASVNRTEIIYSADLDYPDKMKKT